MAPYEVACARDPSLSGFVPLALVKAGLRYATHLIVPQVVPRRLFVLRTK
jgi:hypothetical protein